MLVACMAVLLTASCKGEDDFRDREQQCISKILTKYEGKFVDLNGNNLYLYITQEGEGEIDANDSVKITYTGTALQKNTIFAKNDVVESKVNDLMKAWRIAFESKMITRNSDGLLLVPYKYGFNDKTMGVVEPYSTLLFEFHVD